MFIRLNINNTTLYWITCKLVLKVPKVSFILGESYEKAAVLVKNIKGVSKKIPASEDSGSS